jgi:hypothetical protein
MSVLKRMTDKFSNLGLQHKSSASSTSTAQSYLSVSGPGHNSRLPSGASILYSTDHRGSISTEVTSQSGLSKHVETPDITPLFPQRAAREKGTYKLVDFIIHRTLGMGSFGRVHLGNIST